MKSNPAQDHWNTVYQTKPTDQLSWYEPYPQRSVSTIESFELPRTSRILDVGGGDSRLVDALLERGYRHLAVLFRRQRSNAPGSASANGRSKWNGSWPT